MHGLPEVCNVDDEGEEDDSLEAGNYSNDPPQVSARVNVPVPACQDREFRVFGRNYSNSNYPLHFSPRVNVPVP